MAYTFFTETFEGRSGSIDQRYQRSYTRIFLIGTDSATYGPEYALAHGSLPVLWSAHPGDSTALCLGGKADQYGDDPTKWKVTVTYAYDADQQVPGMVGGGSSGNPAIDTQQQGQAPGSRVANPLSRPRDYSGATTSYPVAIFTDIKGNPIANTAGDPFIPPVEKPMFGKTVTIGLNHTDAPSNAWMSAVGKLNASSLTLGSQTYPARTVRLNSLNEQACYENGVNYWRWTLVFEFRPSTTTYTDDTWVTLGSSWPVLGWKHIVLNRGKRKYNSSDNRFEEITDPPNYGPISEPVFLDANSQPLAFGVKPLFFAYDIYETVTFPSPL